jgi:regulator of protease activity HflC (stomatin/prohibitin superfamily)
MFANVQSLAAASMAHDTSILSLDKVNLEVFAQLSQIDTILQKLTTKEQREEWVKPDDVRDKAVAWYLHVTKMAFDRVQKEREEQQKQKDEEIKKLQAEKEAAEQAKKEEDKVAEAVQQAEAPGVALPEGGGQGADIPEGAQVFGG